MPYYQDLRLDMCLSRDPREVLLRNVRKDFNLGDCVEAIRGAERGTKGFTVHLVCFPDGFAS